MPLVSHEIYVTYEIGHIDEAREKARCGTTVVCFNFFVECELKKQNIPFVSLREVIDTTTGGEEWLLLSYEVAREWYRLPAMKFFEYDGIRIFEAPEPTMEMYLARLFYYVRIYSALKEKYPGARFTIPVRPIAKDMPDVYCLATFLAWTIIDAARMAGLETLVHGTHVPPKIYSFSRPSWKSFLMRAYNFIIGLAPRRGFKIYASEYWTHVAPVVPYLSDGELVLMESTNFYRIPWRQILKHRIRIRYPNGEIRNAERRAVMKSSQAFMEQWKAAKGEVAAYLSRAREGLNWSPVLEACEYLITYAPRIVSDIRTFRRIMEEEKPDVVLQMASIGGPRHYFFLMARVAARLHIPSLELQHAGQCIDPRSMFSRIETDYFASYGADMNSWYERVGYAPERLIPVGSPRFDEYVNRRSDGVEKGKQLFARLGLDSARPVLLAAVPVADIFASATDSYALAEYFGAIRTVQDKTPGLQVLFKFHNDKAFGETLAYLRELFPLDSAVVGSGNIFPLLCASDAAVSPNSTVIFEAVLARKPLILYPWESHDIYHARLHGRTMPLFYGTQKAEAITSIARMCTDASYREELLARQEHFLEGCSFDGQSSSRVAALLYDLSQKSRG